MKSESRKENDYGEVGLQKLLKAIDVADILGISAKTVNKLVRDGKLGCVQVTAKERRFTEEQIRTYIDVQSKDFQKVRVDTLRVRPVSSKPKNGGEKSLGFSRRSLMEEMRQWQ